MLRSCGAEAKVNGKFRPAHLPHKSSSRGRGRRKVTANSAEFEQGGVSVYRRKRCRFFFFKTIIREAGWVSLDCACAPELRDPSRGWSPPLPAHGPGIPAVTSPAAPIQAFIITRRNAWYVFTYRHIIISGKVLLQLSCQLLFHQEICNGVFERPENKVSKQKQHHYIISK